MKRYFLIFIFWTATIHCGAATRISLLTSDPGDLSHTMFGHSALRVTSDDGYDKIYNFGLFNFTTPNFGLKFLGGRLDYWLGRQTLEGFIEVNNKEQRIIREQVLDLDQKTAEAIKEKLNSRQQSEDKYYRYSFTSKNCTSEIRDILTEEGLIQLDQKVDQTYRKMINEYLDAPSWTRFGMNLILGMEMDRKITYEESLFLPFYLETAVQETEGLVIENNVLNSPVPLEPKSWIRYLYSPFVLFSILAVLALFWSPKWWRLTLYFLFGGMGVFISYLWLTTLHVEIQSNLNVLWCNPVFLVLFIALLIRKMQKQMIYILLGFLALTALVFITGFQNYEWSVLPVVALLVILLRKELSIVSAKS